MKTQGGKQSWSTLAAVTLFAVFICALCIGSPWSEKRKTGYPDEERLKNIFASKRDLFEQILKMAYEDKSADFRIDKIDSDSHGVPVTRIHEYRRILASINPDIVLAGEVNDPLGNATLDFTFEGEGGAVMVGPEWFNGIDYISAHIERYGIVVKNSKEIDLKRVITYFIPLEGHWFIYHEQD